MGINYYIITHGHEKWGDSYSIILDYVNQKRKKRIRELVLSNLKNEYKPNEVLFLNKHFQFQGIKPSRDELRNILKKDTVYLHGLFGDENEFNGCLPNDSDEVRNLKIKLPTSSDSKTFTEYIQHLHKYIMSFSNYPNLIGFSMGGRIAFHLKCLYPDSYDKIITISSQIICQENKLVRQKRIKPD